MNRVVLNFLIVEGYKEGAKKFVKEANIDLDDPVNHDLKIDFNEELMDQRMQVRKYILGGRIKQAINLINEINPYVSFKSFKNYSFINLFYLILIDTRQKP